MVKDTSKTLREILSPEGFRVVEDVDVEGLELALEYSEATFSRGQFFAHLHNFLSGVERFYLSNLLGLDWVETEVDRMRSGGSPPSLKSVLENFDFDVFLDNYKVSENLEPVVTSVARYFSVLVDKYPEPDFKLLFSNVLKGAAFLPEKNRGNTLGHLVGWVGLDRQSNTNPEKGYFAPRIVKEILLPLLQEYRAELGRFDPKNQEEQYDEVLLRFSTDLLRASSYTLEKGDSNRKFNPKADDISYAECFPLKGNGEIDFTSLTPQYMFRLMDGEKHADGDKPSLSGTKIAARFFPNEKAEDVVKKLSPNDILAYSLIGHFGAPMRMIHHGPRDGTKKRVDLYFDEGRHQISLEHPSGISGKHTGFYINLVEVVDRIDPNGIGGRSKFKSFISSNR